MMDHRMAGASRWGSLSKGFWDRAPSVEAAPEQSPVDDVRALLDRLSSDDLKVMVDADDNHHIPMMAVIVTRQLRATKMRAMVAGLLDGSRPTQEVDSSSFLVLAVAKAGLTDSLASLYGQESTLPPELESELA